MYELQLKRLRRECGLTQGQLADLVGMNFTTISGWENGRREMGLSDACAVCDALGCTLDELAGRSAINDGSLTTDESSLIDAYRDCDARGRQTIRMLAESQRGISGLYRQGVSNG